MAFRQKKRGQLDHLQNLAITLLTVSALLLFLRTQLYNLSPDGGYLDLLFNGSAPSADIPVAPSALDPQSPVHVVVSGGEAYGRYGDLTLTTADERFAAFKTFLQEALGSAKSFSASNRRAFLQALEDASVYYDFLTPMPLSVLGGLVGSPVEIDTLSVRQLVLAAREDDTVQLLVSDGGDQFSRCDTAISAENLRSILDDFELGNCYFALDYAEVDSHYSQISPLSLFPDPLPALPVLSAAVPFGSSPVILEALGFNPHTNSRYTEANGTEVIVESERSLRLLPDGTIRYNGGANAAKSGALEIKASGELPTLWEAASGVNSLLARLLAGYPNSASLYLLDIQRSDDTTTLYFDYQYSGIPIRFSDGEPAAQIQLIGTGVSSLSLRLRQYAPGTDLSLLLPMRQTIAIAARHPDQELCLAYTSSGGLASAGWLMDE